MGRRVLLCFTLLAALPACSTITTGTVSGQIGLEPRGPEIDAYLAAHPPANAPSETVTGHPTDGSPSASTAYDTARALPGGLAGYELLPEIPESGPAELRMTVESMLFGGGASYRFGANGQLLTPLVGRETVVAYDIKECPALIDTTVKLTGTPSELDRLGDSAGCVVSASVQESSGWSAQALSHSISTTVEQLRGDGVVVPVLVRADNINVRLTATCHADTGASCFVQDPAEPGRAIFESQDIQLPAAPACGTRVQTTIAIPVVGVAGRLTGKADVVGLEPNALRVKVTPAALILDRLTADITAPPQTWTFEGVPQGNQDVGATMIVGGGRAALEFPHRGDPDPVRITACQDADLGNTFVAAPATVAGTLTLRDPRALAGQPTDLQWLNLRPYDPIFNQPVSVPQRTTVFARGEPDAYVAPDGTLGGSGAGAQSYAVPTGSFDTATGEAVLSYALPIVGLSSKDGAADGSQAKPTPWKLEGFDISINKIVNGVQERFQAVRVDSGVSAPLLYTPGAALSSVLRPVCVGEADLRLSFSGANAYDLQFHNIVQNAITQTAQEDGTPLTYRVVEGRGWSARDVQSAAPEVVLGATLPAGRQYKVVPSVRVVNPSTGSETILNLGDRLLPAQGGVRCGDRRVDCETFAADGTPLSRLSVEVTSPQSYCEPNPNLEITLRVTSSSGAPVEVRASIDAGAPELVCSPCTDQQSISHTFSNVPPGTHTVHLFVSDGHCSIDPSATIFTAAPLDMTCPADFSVPPATPAGTVPYEAIASRLVPVWTGGCPWIRPEVHDDHPAEFPRGETTVTFTPVDPYGNERCKTRVTVEAPNACNSVRDLAAGDKGTYWRNGEVRYQTFVPDETLRLVTWNPDGKTDLAIPPRGIGVSLPIGARWLKVGYGVHAGVPLRIRGYTASGERILDQTTPAGESSTQLHCKIFQPTQPIVRLEITGGDNEGVVREICYYRNTPAGAVPQCQ